MASLECGRCCILCVILCCFFNDLKSASLLHNDPPVTTRLKREHGNFMAHVYREKSHHVFCGLIIREMLKL